MRKVHLAAMTAAVILFNSSSRADDAALPGDGFAASKYQALWTKSPFSVASAEAATDSPDYSMVGIVQLDGISYVNLVDKQSNEHFLVSSDKPARGLSIQSVTKGQGASTLQVNFLRNGEVLTLKLDQNATPNVAPSPQPVAAQGMPPGFPGNRPGYPNAMNRPGMPAANGLPRVRVRHRPIVVPPRPQTPAAPNQPPPTPPQ